VCAVLLSTGAMAQVAGNPGPDPFPQGPPVMRRRVPQDRTAGTIQLFQGVLRGAMGPMLTLETKDHRTVEFRVDARTKFVRAGKELGRDALHIGDNILVEARETDGRYTAHRVVIESSPADQTPPGPSTSGEPPKHAPVDEGAPPAARRQPPKPELDPEPTPGPATQMKIEEPPVEAGDPGRPKLVRRRGVPKVAPAREDDPPFVSAPAELPAGVSLAPSEPIKAPSEPIKIDVIDPEIEKARAAVDEYLTSLPAYIVTQVTTRDTSRVSGRAWKKDDTVTLDLVYADGKEDYRNIKINGKPTKKSPTETGTWSTGEFGTLLQSVFNPGSDTEFRRRGREKMDGIDCWIYDFSISRDGTRWLINTGGQRYYPAYKGSVWIDQRTYRVLRLEQKAINLPPGFPADVAETSVDFRQISIGGKPFHLPVEAVALTCERGTSICGRNTIAFRDYRKFDVESGIAFPTAESTISFESPKTPPESPKPAPKQ